MIDSPPWRGFLAAILLVVAAHGAARECPRSAVEDAAIDAFFPPWDDAQKQLIQVLDDACEQILVQAFLLTSREVAAGLLDAHRRGVDVRVLADATQHAGTPSSALSKLALAGIPVWLEDRYRHAHNKVMIIDARTSWPVVITGSYNFTWGAQHQNAENLLIIRSHPRIAERYAANWVRHQLAARPIVLP